MLISGDVQHSAIAGALPVFAKGADPKAIQAQMQHSSISVTFDVYGHLFPGHLDDVLHQLDVDHRAAHDAARPR